MSEQFRAVIAATLALAIMAWLTGIVGAAIPFLILLLTISANKAIALFFYRNGGLFFALGAFLFHQIYYLYSASAFAWVYFDHKVLGRR
jgi:hypothetical protein